MSRRRSRVRDPSTPPVYKGGTIKLISLVIAFIIILAAGGGYYYYYRQSLGNYQTLTQTNPSSQSQEAASDENCLQFNSHYGASASELVHFINNEPDAATVLNGLRNIIVNIKGTVSTNNQSILLKLDTNAKITDYTCEKTAIESLKPRNIQNIDFTIPENDFIQIVRFRETLEADQAQTYLQNVTTNPAEAKNIILSRIQALAT